MQGTIDIMERRNVYGVLSGTPARVAEWSAAAPDRFIRGLGISAGSVSPDSLRRLHANGAVEVLAEVTNQYRGIAPDDPRMDPYWALAEELDLAGWDPHWSWATGGGIYNNAARFLKLTAAEIEAHHSR